MKTLLEKLFDGEISPADKMCVTTKEYNEMLKKECDLEKELISDMNSKERGLYEEMSDKYAQRRGIEREQNFIYAFRLGARLMIEILT